MEFFHVYFSFWVFSLLMKKFLFPFERIVAELSNLLGTGTNFMYKKHNFDARVIEYLVVSLSTQKKNFC